MRLLKCAWNSIHQWAGWNLFTPVRIAGISLGLFGVAFGVWAYLIAHNNTFDWKTLAADYGANISTSLISFTIAVLVIDFLNERRSAREHKRAIIQQMGSQSNAFALEAVRAAQLEGWLANGTLRGANRKNASLQGAMLHEVNLQDAFLVGANLQRARLAAAKLQGACLVEANLQGIAPRFVQN